MSIEQPVSYKLQATDFLDQPVFWSDISNQGKCCQQTNLQPINIQTMIVLYRGGISLLRMRVKS